MKRKVIFGTGLVLFIALLVPFANAVYRTSQSISFFETLAARPLGDSPSDTAVVYGDRLEYAEGKWRYGEWDVTEGFTKTRCNFWKTLEFYLTDPMRRKREKVIFEGPWLDLPNGSKVYFHGHVFHDGSKVETLKIY